MAEAEAERTVHPESRYRHCCFGRAEATAMVRDVAEAGLEPEGTDQWEDSHVRCELHSCPPERYRTAEDWRHHLPLG